MSPEIPAVKGSAPTRRVVRVLEHLAAHGPCTSSQVARSLSLSTSTCALILGELDAVGFVKRHPDLSYDLGHGLIPLLDAARRRFPLMAEAQAVFEQLATDIQASCSLTKLSPDRLEVLITAGGNAPSAPQGNRLPATPPFGVMMAAWWPPQRVEAWLDSSPLPLDEPTKDNYRATLGCLREHHVGGWHYDIGTPGLTDLHRFAASLAADESSQLLRERLSAAFAPIGPNAYPADVLFGDDTIAVSYLVAPVFGASQTPTHQIEVHLLDTAVAPGRRTDLIAALRTTAGLLTEQLGGSAPARHI